MFEALANAPSAQSNTYDNTQNPAQSIKLPLIKKKAPKINDIKENKVIRLGDRRNTKNKYVNGIARF
ncbi:hypothetical protein VCHA49P379_210078 [Vibrio chagasii]|nr:hypothetical protein VCHA29O37_450022 [Vibrio chagasii]CAH7126455.1 hypothetical protein VCHA49P379_210078 [Vibrio chagasii]